MDVDRDRDVDRDESGDDYRVEMRLGMMMRSEK